MSQPESAVVTYRRTHQQYVGGARKLEALIGELIGEEEGINFLSVTARAKDPASFETKACRAHPADQARPKYDDPLRQITDLVAARVITYLPEAVDRVCEVIEREFEIVEQTDMGADVKARGGFGYASRHFLVRLSRSRAELPEYDVLRGLTASVIEERPGEAGQRISGLRCAARSLASGRPATMSQLPSMRYPPSVSTDSGWNCTP